jgi:hypothetical protein
MVAAVGALRAARPPDRRTQGWRGQLGGVTAMRGIRWGRIEYASVRRGLERYANGDWAYFVTIGRTYICIFGGRS